MGKSDNDEDYERGVRDGQKGGFLDDLIDAQFGDSYTPYGKGYNYGVEHRYDSKGQRYHSWDDSGTNDPKKESSSDTSSSWWSSEKKETKVTESYPSDSSYGYDSDRSYRGVPAEETLSGKVFGIGCAIVFTGLLSLIGLGIVGGIRSEFKKESQKKFMQETHRIERYEPLSKLSEENLALVEDSQDFSLPPDESNIVYSKIVGYESNHPLSEAIIVEPEINNPFSNPTKRHRIFRKSLDDGLEEIIGVKDYGIRPWSEGDKLVEELSWEDFVAPRYSPVGEKIAFASTRHDHGSALCLMNNDGTNVQRLSGEHSSIAYGWIDDNIMFLWSGGCSGCDISNYENFKSGKMSLINTSIDERVGLDELPKIDFLLSYVSHGSVKKYNVEDGVEGNQFSVEGGRRLWAETWGKFQKEKEYRENLMDEETLINTRLEEWVNKNTEIGKFNLIDYETIGDDTWVAIQRKYIHPDSQSYVFYSSDDKKTWEFKWGAGSLSRPPFDIEFLNENEGYVITGQSIFYTSNKGDNWEKIFERGSWWGDPEIVDFKIEIPSIDPFNPFNENLSVRLKEGDIYTSSDKGKTWE